MLLNFRPQQVHKIAALDTQHHQNVIFVCDLNRQNGFGEQITMDNNDMCDIDDVLYIAKLVDCIGNKLYLFATESTITFDVILVLTITILCTVVYGNQYTYDSYSNYIDKTDTEYGNGSI